MRNFLRRCAIRAAVNCYKYKYKFTAPPLSTRKLWRRSVSFTGVKSLQARSARFDPADPSMLARRTSIPMRYTKHTKRPCSMTRGFSYFHGVFQPSAAYPVSLPEFLNEINAGYAPFIRQTDVRLFARQRRKYQALGRERGLYPLFVYKNAVEFLGSHFRYKHIAFAEKQVIDIPSAAQQ